MKVLVLRFSSIGDIVLTTPVVRALKTQHENTEVHYATKEAYVNILSENPYIDKIHVLGSTGVNALIKSLKKERFDFVVDLHNNIRTLWIKKRLGVKSSAFHKLNIQKWLLVNFKINLLPNKHIVERYLDTLSPLGIKGDQLGLDYFIPTKDEVSMDWLPETHRDAYYVLVVGAKFGTKRLPVQRLIELCDRINKPIVLLGGKEDEKAGRAIEEFFEKTDHSAPYEEGLKEGLNKKSIIFNGCGKFNLNQSASLVRQSRAVFTHDTGLMHIAAAFKKQVFSVWGNTVPAFGMYPYKTKFSIFENNKLGCRPCSKIGHDKCPLGHFKCMNEVIFDFYLP